MLKVELINSIYVASFENINKFTALISELIKEQLNNLLQKPGTKVILNLDGISYIDSTGFGVFLSAMKTANVNGAHFKLCNISKEVMELFKLLQLHNIFEIYTNLDDCLKSYKT
jgi:anti-sigma B factor antagonist